MPSELLERLKRINAPRPPEESLLVRMTTLAGVMVGVIALKTVDAIPAGTTWAVLLLLPVGYYVSWRLRGRNNWLLKAALALAALLVLWRFLAAMRGVMTVDVARYPLAELFIWVQVIHGFDVPSRRDLYFSMGASVGLIAIAASVAQTSTFGIFLVIYGLCALTALAAAHRSELIERTSGALVPAGAPPGAGAPSGTGEPRGGFSPLPIRSMAAALGATLLIGGVAALALPRSTGSQALSMPFDLGLGFMAPGDGSIFNPFFRGGDKGRQVDGSYYGISNELDLRVRGELGDQLVMRVRSGQAAMWKGAVFDAYDGVRWTISGGTLPVEGGPRYFMGMPLGMRRKSLVQTFFIETGQPNVVYAAEQPTQIYLPTRLKADLNGTLRSAVTLGPGSVYSVVSALPTMTADLKRISSYDYPPMIRARYLQLPRGIPKRVPELAQKITASSSTQYGKVKAIEDYLRSNYRYTLDSAPPPPFRDAVDHFLFDERQGFCEQFASSAAVLLRSVGIPTRLVAGFMPGDRNFLSGYYNVHADDAHSWIEVYFPGHGWYPFDPTSDVPQAESEASAMFPGVKLIAASASWATAQVAATARSNTRYVLAILVVITLFVLTVQIANRRHRARAMAPTAHHPVVRRFESMSSHLAEMGLSRSPDQTPSEYGNMLARKGGEMLPETLINTTIEAVELAAYAQEPPDDDASEEAIASMDELEERLNSVSFAGHV